MRPSRSSAWLLLFSVQLFFFFFFNIYVFLSLASCLWRGWNGRWRIRFSNTHAQKWRPGEKRCAVKVNGEYKCPMSRALSRTERRAEKQFSCLLKWNCSGEYGSEPLAVSNKNRKVLANWYWTRYIAVLRHVVLKMHIFVFQCRMSPFFLQWDDFVLASRGWLPCSTRSNKTFLKKKLDGHKRPVHRTASGYGRIELSYKKEMFY